MHFHKEHSYSESQKPFKGFCSLHLSKLRPFPIDFVSGKAFSFSTCPCALGNLWDPGSPLSYYS